MAQRIALKDMRLPSLVGIGLELLWANTKKVPSSFGKGKAQRKLQRTSMRGSVIADCSQVTSDVQTRYVRGHWCIEDQVTEVCRLVGFAPLPQDPVYFLGPLAKISSTTAKVENHQSPTDAGGDEQHMVGHSACGLYSFVTITDLQWCFFHHRLC